MSKEPQRAESWRNRIVGDDTCDPSQLLANPYNWRIHPHEQELALRGILDEVGWVQNIIVNKRTGHVVDGHLRVATAISKGEKAVPVLYVDLTEDEEKKVLLTIDPVGAMAVMDADKFKELLAEVEFASEDARKSIDAAAEDAGVELGEPETDTDAEPQIDRAAELNKKWKVKAGDLWRIGEHRLLCGDSTKREDVERVMGGENSDLCFTSPPYALGKSVALSGNKTMASKGNAYGDHDDNPSEWDALMRGWFDCSRDFVSDVWVINVQPLAGNKRQLLRFIADHADRLVDIATWDKGHSAPPMASGVMASRFEWMVIFSSKEDATRSIPLSSWRGTVQSVYTAPPQRNNEYSESHAATMPIHVPVWVFQTLCDKSKRIFDPFLGSGTTMVACENLKRKCRGIEISPDYCAVILERMATAFPQLKAERIK
jgi:DNA modification methylase